MMLLTCSCQNQADSKMFSLIWFIWYYWFSNFAVQAVTTLSILILLIPATEWFNTLRPRRNEQHFADDIFKCIFVNENVWISIKISLKFVPKGPISNIPALVQIMAWCHLGDKPLSEPKMVSLLTHICITCPQWVKLIWPMACQLMNGLGPLSLTWFN